jgi:hypothetical protein
MQFLSFSGADGGRCCRAVVKELEGVWKKRGKTGDPKENETGAVSRNFVTVRVGRVSVNQL